MQKWIMYAIGAIVFVGLSVFSLGFIVYEMAFVTPKPGVASTVCCAPFLIVFGLLAVLCAYLGWQDWQREKTGKAVAAKAAKK